MVTGHLTPSCEVLGWISNVCSLTWAYYFHAIVSFLFSTEPRGAGHELGSCFKWCARFINCVPVLSKSRACIYNETDRHTALCGRCRYRGPNKSYFIFLQSKPQVPPIITAGGSWLLCVFQTLFKAGQFICMIHEFTGQCCTEERGNAEEIFNFMTEFDPMSPPGLCTFLWLQACAK